jgi:hypothetical protein
MGITNLTINTGKAEAIRAQAATPTSPSPESGEIYFDISSGAEALGFYKTSGWVYVSAIPAP